MHFEGCRGGLPCPHLTQRFQGVTFVLCLRSSGVSSLGRARQGEKLKIWVFPEAVSASWRGGTETLPKAGVVGGQTQEALTQEEGVP